MADPITAPFLSWTTSPTDGSSPDFQWMDFDVVFKVQPSHAGISTDSPVQQGINVTDNCRRQPVRLVTEFAIIGADKGLAAYDKLVALQRDATLVSFTQARTWSDMFVELVEIPDTLEPVMGRIRFVVHLKEILLTTIKVTPPAARPVPARKPVKRGHQDSKAPTTTTGANWQLTFDNSYSAEAANPLAEPSTTPNAPWGGLLGP